MQDEALSIIIKLRNLMDSYLLLDPEYKTSLVPYLPQSPAPQIFHDMSAVCKRSEIGPMSAVAGAVAKYTALELKKKFPYKEIMVENGGDIYIDIKEDIDIAVFAGQSPLSNRVGLHIPASVSPVGVCTSSGTVGPSLSFGGIVQASLTLLSAWRRLAKGDLVSPNGLQPPLKVGCQAREDAGSF